MAQSVRTVSGDFDLTMDELRIVARYVVRHAEDVLPVFEQAVPDDPRPRAAIDAAWTFINGADRTRRQRIASLDAHRAARSAPPEAARLAARSAGDAASAAYLHPIAQASQVGHILRAAASAARIGELQAGGDPASADALLERSRQRATPVLTDVLRRYPPATGGTARVARLMSILDRSLRDAGGPPAHDAESRADARDDVDTGKSSFMHESAETRQGAGRRERADRRTSVDVREDADPHKPADARGSTTARIAEGRPA